MIYFSKSNNVGVMFNNRVLVNDTTGLPSYNVDNPSISIADTILYAAWLDTRNSGNCDIYNTKSIDGGQTFLKPNTNLIDATGSSFYQGYPSLCCDDSGGVYCVWEDQRNYVNSAEQIYMGYSKNYGDSFSLNYHVDDRGEEDSAWLWTPTICANKSGKVFAAWMDNRNNDAASRFDIYTTGGTFVGVTGEPPNNDVMLKYTNIKPYPNPFATSINIEYQTPANSNVELSIYNINGQLVKRLVAGYKNIGKYTIVWNGRDNLGDKVSQGIYLLYMNADGKTQTQKITYLK